MKITATGTPVSSTTEGGQSVTVWRTEVPQTVAGFNFGRFKMEEAKLAKPEYLVQSYANQEPPNWVTGLQHSLSDELPTQESHLGAPVAMGNMNTTGMIKHALAEGEVSVQLYSDYFGPIPYKRLAMTQQTACTFGQAWPTLVWLPICSFFDATVRHNLGLDQSDRGYWKTVAPHEVAHQWWGHMVGFNSYRDQWMSEGFADMSASLYVQMIEKNPKKFAEFWNDERELLTQKNKEGFRAIDAGPVTLGYRLSNSRGGFNTTRDLIYPKGAYILHMSEVLGGKYTDAQIAALLVALHMKGETVEEIVGFAEAIRAAATPLRLEQDSTVDVSGTGRDALVDTCGTGGDASGTFNISTATAFVVAGAGVRVAKHGNRSVTSKCGSADVMEALGVKIDLSPQRVAACLNQLGIAFLFAPAMHSAMKHVQAARRELRLRTVFNLLGPLTNPAHVR